MNTIKISIFILGVLLLSCSSRPSNNSDNKSSVDQETLTSDNSFDEFIKEFSEDSSFQLTRIKFPVTYSYSSQDDETGAMETVQIPKREWKKINLIGKGGFEEAVEITKSIKGSNTIELLVQGVDTGLSVTYCFEKENGLWYLIKIIDQSN